MSDATHRQHFLRGGRWDWKGFFEAAIDDPPIEAGVAMAQNLAPGTAMVILTARPSYMTDGTKSWLADKQVDPALLILRPPDDSRSSVDFKRDELSRLRAAGYEVLFAIDDDEVNTSMYREEGLFALYVHSGYYEK